MTFEEEAKKAIADCGLEGNQHELLCWAFGDDYDGQLIRNLRTRWNSRHGEIFQLELTQSVYDQFCRIAKAYKMPEPSSRIGWRAFPMTVDAPEEEQEDGDKEATQP